MVAQHDRKMYVLTVDGVTPAGVDLHADSTESIAGPLAFAVCTNTTNVWSGENNSTKRERE